MDEIVKITPKKVIPGKNKKIISSSFFISNNMDFWEKFFIYLTGLIKSIETFKGRMGKGWIYRLYYDSLFDADINVLTSKLYQKNSSNTQKNTQIKNNVHKNIEFLKTYIQSVKDYLKLIIENKNDKYDQIELMMYDCPKAKFTNSKLGAYLGHHDTFGSIIRFWNLFDPDVELFFSVNSSHAMSPYLAYHIKKWVDSDKYTILAKNYKNDDGVYDFGNIQEVFNDYYHIVMSSLVNNSNLNRIKDDGIDTIGLDLNNTKPENDIKLKPENDIKLKSENDTKQENNNNLQSNESKINEFEKTSISKNDTQNNNNIIGGFYDKYDNRNNKDDILIYQDKKYIKYDYMKNTNINKDSIDKSFQINYVNCYSYSDKYNISPGIILNNSLSDLYKHYPNDKPLQIKKLNSNFNKYNIYPQFTFRLLAGLFGIKNKYKNRSNIKKQLLQLITDLSDYEDCKKLNSLFLYGIDEIILSFLIFPEIGYSYVLSEEENKEAQKKQYILDTKIKNTVFNKEIINGKIIKKINKYNPNESVLGNLFCFSEYYCSRDDYHRLLPNFYLEIIKKTKASIGSFYIYLQSMDEIKPLILYHPLFRSIYDNQPLVKTSLIKDTEQFFTLLDFTNFIKKGKSKQSSKKSLTEYLVDYYSDPKKVLNNQSYFNNIINTIEKQNTSIKKTIKKSIKKTKKTKKFIKKSKKL